MYSSQYTVESVTSGHPDKVCDQISDAILDALLTQDPMSRVAVETLGAHGKLIVTGEVTSTGEVDYAEIVRRVYHKIGHEDELNVEAAIVQQSPDIANGVDTGGAGDQGIMYGFATDETPELMPLGVVLAHKLTRQLETVRRHDPEMAWVKPDGKSQVTIHNGQVTAVVVSTQHDASVPIEQVRTLVREKVIKPVIGDLTNVKVYVNPAGPFTIGGFTADSGLTGRKIMVDTYGGLIAHGGGAFSGKDATKVDRSAAYFSRYVARQVVKAGLGKRCLVSVAYAIGEPEPVMLTAVNDRGANISCWVRENFDFRPRAIIERLNLRRPIFQPTAAYGHFGRPEFPWENVPSQRIN